MMPAGCSFGLAPILHSSGHFLTFAQPLRSQHGLQAWNGSKGVAQRLSECLTAFSDNHSYRLESSLALAGR